MVRVHGFQGSISLYLNMLEGSGYSTISPRKKDILLSGYAAPNYYVVGSETGPREVGKGA